MANIEQGDASTSDIQAVSRVGQICSLFGPGAGELTAADVAERTGLNRTTAYRYCASMAAAGILERGSRRGTFALGGLMLQLGVYALERQRVVDLAPSYLEELCREVGMTAVLSVWGARGPVVALVSEDTRRTVLVTVRVGTHLDATAAQTLVFLAHGDQSQFDAVSRDLSADDRRLLHQEVEEVRRRGISVMEHPDGLFAASAPVFDERGIRATMALLGSNRGADLSDASAILQRLEQKAAALSDELRFDRRAAHADL